MAGRETRFKDSDEAMLLERSRQLIAQLDELIDRAKALTAEHKEIRQKIKEKRQRSQLTPSEIVRKIEITKGVGQKVLV